jgi:hypothetical protein
MTIYSTVIVYRSMSMRYSSLRYISVPGIKGLILQQGLVSLLTIFSVSCYSRLSTFNIYLNNAILVLRYFPIRDTLPPKKLLGSKDPGFIMRRRRELESYIQNVFHFLSRDLPPVLAEFLDFHKVRKLFMK